MTAPPIDKLLVRSPWRQWPVRSASSLHCWPALPSAEDASSLAIYHQLDDSQWWSRRKLLTHQLEQASALIEHAYRTVPFYRQRAGIPPGQLTLAKFRSLPIVSRQDLQSAGDLRFTRALPRPHEPATEVRTSGSTGRPLSALTTRVTRSIYRAMNLRVADWYDLDVSARMGSVRPALQDVSNAGWLPGIETGDIVQSEPTLPVEDQIAWLARTSPRYLQSYPSVIAAIAQAARGVAIPTLERIFTFGEMLEPWVRELCREVLHTEIVDCYSTIECGMLALQCPGSVQYHVMGESALVEVLDERGRPCGPGTVGRVVVTILHNFATPFIRYDTGDHAEVGRACPCGRGLPTLARIVGRSRNLLTLPDGRRRWPFAHPVDFAGRDPVRQFQIVQTALDALEVRLVLTRPFSKAEQEEFANRLLAAIGRPFQLQFKFPESIPRGPGGKYEDFIGLQGRPSAAELTG